MTTSPDPSTDRLDRIEGLLLATVQQQAANTQAIASQGVQQALNTQAIASLTSRLDIVVQRVDTLSNSINTLVPIIQAVQSDIRGLQTENRRILERLERGQGGQP